MPSHSLCTSKWLSERARRRICGTLREVLISHLSEHGCAARQALEYPAGESTSASRSPGVWGDPSSLEGYLKQPPSNVWFCVEFYARWAPWLSAWPRSPIRCNPRTSTKSSAPSSGNGDLATSWPRILRLDPPRAKSKSWPCSASNGLLRLR